MLFYEIKLTCALRYGESEEIFSSSKQSIQKIQDIIRLMNEESKNQCIFLSDCREDSDDDKNESEFVFGAIARRPLDATFLERFVEKIEIPGKSMSHTEITFDDLLDLLQNAKRSHYLAEYDRLLQKFSLDKQSRFARVMCMQEDLFQVDIPTEKLYEKARVRLSNSLCKELDRIFAVERCASPMGHPVHYIIESDRTEFARTAAEILLCALYRQGRITSRRYTTLEMAERRCFDPKLLYQMSEGSCVLLDVFGDGDEESRFADVELDRLESACAYMKEYCNETLTIILLPTRNKKQKDVLQKATDGCVFISISQDEAKGLDAKQYLSYLAGKYSLKEDDSLYEELEDLNTSYPVEKLDAMFRRWHSRQLLTTTFPAYANLESELMAQKEKKQTEGAYGELQQMIGLMQPKQLIEEAIDYFAAQKMYRDMGFAQDHPAMHMVFTGNPGTAKTTVARLFAEIMKENGLLPDGGFYEVGRADLVGKYVGWTAKLVQKAFDRARGGVLFIDEAYSLVEGEEGLYGDEAINTIVQEMENRAEDTVVILAGYPKEMERFLDRNSGLRSRIAFHVQFPDYTPEELFDITRLLAKKKGMHLHEGAEEKLRAFYEQMEYTDNFGNGRFARNIVEKAKMAHARNLLQHKPDKVTRKEVTTLWEEDFDFTGIAMEKQQKQPIGFIC